MNSLHTKLRSVSTIIITVIAAADIAAMILLTSCVKHSAAKTNAATTQSAPVVRVGMECAFAPNNWEESSVSETNLHVENHNGFYAEGYDVQIAKLVAKNMGAAVQIVKLPWNGLLPALDAGQIDLIVSGMLDSKEHLQAADFSSSYAIAKTEYAVMVQKNSRYVHAQQLSDLSGASLLGQKGTKLDSVIDQVPGVNHVSPVDSIPNMLARLNRNTVDGIIINLDSANAYLKANPDLAVIDFAEGKGFVLDFSGICVGVRKGDAAMLAKVNKALASIS